MPELGPIEAHIRNVFQVDVLEFSVTSLVCKYVENWKWRMTMVKIFAQSKAIYFVKIVKKTSDLAKNWDIYGIGCSK